MKKDSLDSLGLLTVAFSCIPLCTVMYVKSLNLYRKTMEYQWFCLFSQAQMGYTSICIPDFKLTTFLTTCSHSCYMCCSYSGFSLNSSSSHRHCQRRRDSAILLARCGARPSALMRDLRCICVRQHKGFCFVRVPLECSCFGFWFLRASRAGKLEKLCLCVSVCVCYCRCPSASGDSPKATQTCTASVPSARPTPSRSHCYYCN